jgi:hypothetical protein
MIQLNLLPDVKLEYIKAQRLKNTLLSVSIIASLAALAVFALLFLTADVWQKKTISDLSKDITSQSQKLKSTKDLNKILTIQSQLASLDSLHNSKPVVTRLPDFISQLTPADATIADIKTDYDASTITITGAAPSLDVVNTFVDGLKFTKYTKQDSSDKKTAFTSVVLTSFTRDAQHATYTITATYDQPIFLSDGDVTLSVPNIISTRSITEQPGAVFEKNSEDR